ncbi:TonB-dependent receptor [Croceibacterium ferulae]|uniref:TonB-dependent receptor n=1 Tax=Croceibacterium ferulae TaxID=1854641 RepID=UPI000EB4ECA3|nr:TonB-dependent receptor [Croceibacterium ferulae]
MRSLLLHRHTAFLTLISALGLPCSVRAAEDAATPAGEEIVVSAQRRTETLISTPLAISVLQGAEIERRNLDDIKDIVTFTPGFSGNSDDSYIDGLAVRGIASNDYGIGGDSSIGIFKDGVYQGRTGSAVTTLFDIERAEALRGPQGFLFGRNAISGAISILTNKPRIGGHDAYVYLTGGDIDRLEAQGAVNVPLADKIAARVAFYATTYDGWVDNVFTQDLDDALMGGSKLALRPSLRFEDGPLQITLTGEYERRQLDGTPYRASNDDREVLDAINDAMGNDLVIGGTRRVVDSDLVDPRDDGTIGGTNLQADLDLSFATLTAISAYRHHRFYYSEDYDGTPLLLGNYTQRQHGTYASQDVRLVSPGSDRLTWSAGVSAYRETVRARFTNEADEEIVCRAGYAYTDCEEMTQDLYGRTYSPAPDGVLVDVNDARSTSSGLSAYGDLNYWLLSRLQLGAGLRYTWDRKRFALDVLPSDSSLGNVWTFSYYTDGFIEAEKAWDGLTPRFYLRFEAARNINLYASVTRGHKAGGFGSFTVAAPAPVDDYGEVPDGTRPNSFAPETIWSKEIGLKASLFDRALDLDVTAFHYAYRNLQTVFFDTETRTQQIINVGRVRGYGAEAIATLRPSRYFDLSGNITYTHTAKSGDRECAESDCGGLLHPIWATSGVATARYPFAEAEAFLSAEWSHEGRRRESFDWRGITRRPRYTEVNLRLGYSSDQGWQALVYVENLFDRRYIRGVENGGDLTPATVWGVSQPRSLGVSLRWQLTP